MPPVAYYLCLFILIVHFFRTGPLFFSFQWTDIVRSSDPKSMSTRKTEAKPFIEGSCHFKIEENIYLKKNRTQTYKKKIERKLIFSKRIFMR